MVGKLDRRGADAAGATMDKQRFAGLEFAALNRPARVREGDAVAGVESVAIALAAVPLPRD